MNVNSVRITAATLLHALTQKVASNVNAWMDFSVMGLYVMISVSCENFLISVVLKQTLSHYLFFSFLLDECLDAKDNDCNKYATCVNSPPGSYSCQCLPGFEGEGLGENGCQDIDQCKLGTDNCDSNAKCKNLPGFFACECSEGYEGSGTHCEDVGKLIF